MITLPTPRRSHLQSFGIIAGLFLSTLLGILLQALTSPLFAFIAWLIGWIPAAIGMTNPERLSPLYNSWNRLAAAFSRRARLLLMRVCYNIFICVVCAGGSRLMQATLRSDQSYWVDRKTLRVSAYGSQYNGPSRSADNGWLSDFLAWSASSGNRWAWFLTPFIILIRLLETDEQETYPASIYTLF
jgi:hypothetical protein